MKYPRLEIDLHKIEHNAHILVDQCKEKGIDIAGVTKVFCGNPRIAQAMIDGGVSMLADSRIDNLKKLKGLKAPKMLLRIPMMSEAKEVVEYSDVSLNSEIEVITKLSEEALKKMKVHQIILMVDLGDLREGIWEDELLDTVDQIIFLKGVHLAGLGVNFGCYGGIIPEPRTLEKLINMKKEIQQKYHISLEILSGANSNALYLVWNGTIPKGINQLRCGQSIVLGKEDVFYKTIDGLYDDAFRLFAEVVEIKNKPSHPIGKIGRDAFASIPTFEDIGIRKRAIAAIGRQDISLDGLKITDEGVNILGGSSDHLLLDITDAKREFHIGDIIELNLNYGCLLASTTSPYVDKVFL